ncbi:hypothetical protein DIPPA_16926 [Diplonema papillatum]|nr:hypothetical protein DIPPA_16926 [Diplonema papillatum]
MGDPIQWMPVLVHLLDPSEPLGCGYGFTEDDYMFISEVKPGGALGRAGVEEGMFIKSIDGIDVRSKEELMQVIPRFRQKGTTALRLVVCRPSEAESVDGDGLSQRKTSLVPINVTLRTGQPLGALFVEVPGKGVAVLSLKPESPCIALGLKPGWEIHSFNGAPISTVFDLQQAMLKAQALADGGSVVISLMTRPAAPVDIPLGATTPIPASPTAMMPPLPAHSPLLAASSPAQSSPTKALPGRPVMWPVRDARFKEPSERGDALGDFAVQYPPPPFPTQGGVGGPPQAASRVPRRRVLEREGFTSLSKRPPEKRGVGSRGSALPVLPHDVFVASNLRQAAGLAETHVGRAAAASASPQFVEHTVPAIPFRAPAPFRQSTSSATLTLHRPGVKTPAADEPPPERQMLVTLVQL